MKVTLAQVKLPLGRVSFNEKKVLKLLSSLKDSDFLLLPEGGLVGYPPEDLILKESLLKAQDRAHLRLQSHLPPSLSILMGGFKREKKKLFNGVFLIKKKEITFFKKGFLANKDVFFESRHFLPGKVEENFFYWKKKRIQILICEDMFQQPSFPKADGIFCLNSSPHTKTKAPLRLKQAQKICKKNGSALFYLNRVGGQGEILYDGGSFALNGKGVKVGELPFFKEEIKTFSNRVLKKTKTSSPLKTLEEALLMGIEDFVKLNHFQKVHLGLSGGVDSALVCVLACKALGVKNVKAFFLPSPYTSNLSFKIVSELKKKYGFALTSLSISELFEQSLKDFPQASSLVKQNLQARLRSLLLMTYSNQEKSLLLGTGNKSELLCGYSTLYGDLSGGLLPLGDLYKTEVWNLAHFLKLPKQVLTRAPTAELKPNQKDTDDLPNYKKLDAILKSFMQHQSPQTSLEKKIFSLILKQEFKRRQAPPILKVSDHDLGAGWRFPLVSASSFDF